MCKSIAEIQLESLKKELEKRNKDYRAVSDKKIRESNPEQEDNLERQLKDIENKIKKIEQKIKDLEDKAKDIKIEHLQEILINLAKEEGISVIKKAHRACSPEGWLDVPTDEPKAILADVMKMPKGDSRYTKDEHFVACLLALIENPLLSNKLNEWANSKENFENLINQEKQNLDKISKDNQNSYFIVYVRKTSKKDDYFVDAWFIPDGDTYHNENHFHCEQIIHEQNRKSFTLKEIRKDVINCFLNQIRSKCSDRQLKIEIFLPLELINEPVDNWEFQDKNLPLLSEPENLGFKYKSIVVRSSERVEPSYLNSLKQNWQSCWNILQDIIQNRVIDPFIFSEDDNFKDLKSQFQLQLQQQKIFGIIRKVPIQTENQKFIITILQMAAPVALWLRPEVPPSCNKQIDELLRCCIDELIINVSTKRIEAFPKPQDSHIGHHISLLWEDPNRLPPDINYSMYIT